MISHLAGQGAGHVLEDSSGNGGSSVAAYSAAAGIKATIIVPAATSPVKILQARAFGAEVALVGGTRDQVSDEAIRRSAQIPYASYNWHSMFLQGTKTIGYEMWEQLGFRAPENVVLVAGAGSNILGCDLAFSELLAAGQIDRLPRLLVAQPEHWATIADTVDEVDPASRGPRRPTMRRGPRSRARSGSPRPSQPSTGPAVPRSPWTRNGSRPRSGAWPREACTPSPPARSPRPRSTTTSPTGPSLPARRPCSS